MVSYTMIMFSPRSRT